VRFFFPRLSPKMSTHLSPATSKDALLRIFVVCVYVVCGAAFAILVKASRSNVSAEQKYEPAAVTTVVEFLKLGMALVYFLSDHENASSKKQLPAQKFQQLLDNRDLFWRLSVPAGLYFVFNILAFFSLDLVEPATYRVILTSKIFWSGLLLQCIGIRLSRRQWLALVLLFVACTIEQFGSFSLDTGFIALASLLIQAFSSSAAGVYFQLMLQRISQHGQPEPGLWHKNVVLYAWSVAFNLLYLAMLRPDLLNPFTLLGSFSGAMIPLVFVGAFGGFATSLMLKHLDVLIKEYANFFEMILVMFASNLMFGSPVSASLILAIVLCSVSLYLYNTAPAPAPVTARSDKSPDEQDLELQRAPLCKEVEMAASSTSTRPINRTLLNIAGQVRSRSSSFSQ